MIINQVKTVIFLGALAGILLLVGSFWGATGLTIAIVLAVAINFGTYWFSDKIVLKMYKATPIEKGEYTWLKEMVSKLAKKANIPVPKIYLLPQSAPNAFATGRDPKHAAVAATVGLLELLTKDEVEAVLAHEISHIVNRDTLIQTVAATIAAVISYAALLARFSLFFGDRDRMLETLAFAILTPILALIIQLAISRSREYMADEGSARLLRNGESLASALKKIDLYSRKIPFRMNKATAHMFIANPFRGILSTHPPVEKRIAKLKEVVL